jgi:hypothetical protein
VPLSSVHFSVQVLLGTGARSCRSILARDGLILRIDNLDETHGCFSDLDFRMIRRMGTCGVRDVLEDSIALGIE